MGVTSIIAILVILVLIVFAALSITTAKADLNLSQRTANAATAFYKADSEAEDRFAEVTEAVKNGDAWRNELPGDYTTESVDDGITVSYEVPVDDHKALYVRLLVTEDGAVARALWQVRATTEWEANDDVQLIIE
jgi:hypothetical protein